MSLRLLEEKLDKGLFVNNLRDMARICVDLARNEEPATAFYVLRSIFLDVASDWDERPLSPEEVERVESKLMPSILEVIYTLKNREPVETICHALDLAIKNAMMALG